RFLNWDLPYAALVRRLGGHVQDHPSPFSPGPPTPDYIAVGLHDHPSPDPREAMSPTAQLVDKKVLIDRAHLLLSGRDRELMKQLTRDERRTAATWLHDGWMFSFMTTKYWGKGPRHWNPSLIHFKTFAGVIESSFEDNSGDSMGAVVVQSPSTIPPVVDPPTQLCRWSIHYKATIKYDPIPEQDTDIEAHSADQFDVEDESTWPKWEPYQDLSKTLAEASRDNSFTTIKCQDLPLAADKLVNTAAECESDTEVEAIGFAIMSRNTDVLLDLLDAVRYNDRALRDISPFHLAARFLDGAKACCNVMSLLVRSLDDDCSIGVNYTDKSGLTVLDTLFISILRSHSSITPDMLGGSFASDKSHFDGGDVDVCGRWDADSPCIRHLHVTGEATIPTGWKHMFCHTSVQAVYHCITTIFVVDWRPDINTVSGLFRRRCKGCGLELALGPIHALVFISYHLANSGLPGETLFGMLACLVCLITFRADPSLSLEISIPAILGIEEAAECQHRAFNAAELAAAVPEYIISAWTSEVQLGWSAIVQLLRHQVKHAQGSTSTATKTSKDHSQASFNKSWDASKGIGGYCHHNIHSYELLSHRKYVKCGDKQVGMIWAAIQVELLTYRRLKEDDPWLSPFFNMQDVLKGLQDHDGQGLQLLVNSRGEDMFTPFSRCGLFLWSDHPGCVRGEEACSSYCGNLDDWKRTSFIESRSWKF
ncbi:hypothetical protein M406DRAFT_248280, partial [Cryphonectria parasitica EP155]